MADVLTVAITAAVTLGVSWGSVYLGHCLQLARETKLRDRDARVRVFATLMGHKVVLAQLYVSRFEAFIFSDYHEHLWRLAGHPANSLDCAESQRWMHKSEDLVLEITRARQELFEAVASAKILFPSCKELSNLTEAVYKHEVPSLAVRPGPNMESAKLEEWKTKAVPQVQQLVRETIEAAIESLVGYLAPLVC